MDPIKLKRCCGQLHKGEMISELFFGKGQKACKSCMRLYAQARYSAKKDEIRAYNSAYKRANREAMNAYNRRWDANNPERKRASDERYRSKPKNHLRANMKNRMRKWLGRFISNTEMEQLMGCSIENWMSWLQAKFTPGMGWKNYGSGIRPWEIDHYFPLSSFDKTDPDQIKRALCYQNTRPLWRTDNRIKGAKVPLPLAA